MPVGGHNVLEPALWAKPVFFGPHTDHCAESASLLVESGGGQEVRDGASLADSIATLLRDPAALEARGQAAYRAVMQNRGALERTLAIIQQVLEKERERRWPVP